MHLPVEAQHLTEDQYQHHADKDPGLLHVGSDTILSHDADTISGSKAGHSHRNTAS